MQTFLWMTSGMEMADVDEDRCGLPMTRRDLSWPLSLPTYPSATCGPRGTRNLLSSHLRPPFLREEGSRKGRE